MVKLGFMDLHENQKQAIVESIRFDPGLNVTNLGVQNRFLCKTCASGAADRGHPLVKVRVPVFLLVFFRFPLVSFGFPDFSGVFSLVF